MSEVADAPLFIDDSPNMSLMEIRAKCRRLKQRHDLKLVIIDDLQLDVLAQASGKPSAGSLRDVAVPQAAGQELEVPVVALSQLNPGPEQRQDKKPMLFYLRESGCLTGDSRILPSADTGAEVTFDGCSAMAGRESWSGPLTRRDSWFPPR